VLSLGRNNELTEVIITFCEHNDYNKNLALVLVDRDKNEKQMENNYTLIFDPKLG